MKNINTVILGAAGEHYVMAELLRRGFVAAKAPEGVPNFDIVITDINGERLAAIQVKSKRGFARGDKGWHMKAKHEELNSARMFYVFVDLGSDETSPISFFVVPSSTVAYVCNASHKHWIEMPNAKGGQHSESKMRRLLPKYEIPAYARTRDYQPTPQHKKFLEEYGEGWMEKYRDAWGLISENVV